MNRDELVKRAARMKPPEPTFDFGKWKGKTVAFVLEQEPGYIEWFFDHVERHRHPKTLTRAVYKEARLRVDDADQEMDPDFWEPGIFFD